MQEMLRVLALLFGLGLSSLAAQAADLPRIAPRPLASALEAMAAGRWDVAAALAARDGPAAADLIEWYRLSAGRGAPSEILDFLDRNGHWPGLNRLRRASEAPMTRAAFDDVLAFYKGYRPQTGTGALNLARAHLARGRQGEAEAGIVLAWRTLDLTPSEHADFRRDFGPLLRPHHDARLDTALWRGWRAVEDMLPLASDAARQRAELRAQAERGEADDLTEAQTREPGIAFERFNRALQRDAEEAIAILLRQSRIRDGLGEPERWASWRRYLARQQMRDGALERAYELAAVHHLVEGAQYADLEWLAGYIALRHLEAPELALDHFQRFRAAVSTPISLGRAGYWIGRAQEALGDDAAAAFAYGEGAAHPTSFYGLLAAEKAGTGVEAQLRGDADVPPWRSAAFARGDLKEIGTLALRLGDLSLSRRFFVQLSEGLDRTGLIQLGQMLAELDQPYLQVMVGKAGAARGIVAEAAYYPLYDLPERALAAPAELVLSIARRESEFNPVVASPAGARGLMQLMPATARAVAGDLGLAYDASALLGDPAYNARLGAAYLDRLLTRYGGNILLVAAAYNAGPSRAATWIDENGDPRLQDAHGIVDWIEHIPFRETRNYVMRVAESLPIYRARLGDPALPRPFSQELAARSLTGLYD
ncbi:lytic transglycosylase domain-containing protein [Roseovarius sp. D22-M7]|uniref:lytic transglycosylase domain-containing protein n=1 Tax=Roseovarius sp. D22-M7 TaxID=3127116 RepID=UPI00300FB710